MTCKGMQKKVLWSNKTTIEVVCSLQVSYLCWKTRTADHAKYTIPTLKHSGGGIILRGCLGLSEFAKKRVGKNHT